jgi:hypothetical protein
MTRGQLRSLWWANTLAQNARKMKLKWQRFFCIVF